MDEWLRRSVEWTDRLAARLERGGVPVSVVAAGVVGVLVILHATAPAVVVSDMLMDVFVPLDAGWRRVAGQVPHVDFDTPVGRLYYDAYGAAMGAFGADSAVILQVPAILAPVVGMLCAVVGVGRLPPLVLGLLGANLTLMACSPIHLDRDGLVHLASYNRIGWGLVAVVLLASAVPRRRPSRIAAAVDGVVCTAVLVVLFYVKITYFALGGLGLLIAVAVVPANRWWALIAGVATWLAVGATFAASDVPWAYVDDIRGAAASFDPVWAQAGGSRTPGLEKLGADLLDNLWVVILTFGGLAALARTAEGDDDLEAVANRVGLAGAGVLVATLVVGVQSHDHHNPALVVAAVVALAGFLARADGTRDRRIALALTVGFALVTGPRIARDAFGILLHRYLAGSPDGQVTLTDDPASPSAGVRFVAPRGLEGSKLHLVRDGRVDADAYMELVDGFDGADLALLARDGAARITEHAGADATSLTMLFASPFPVVMGTRPPTGTRSWYHPSRTFGGDNPLVPEVVLADVDVVLVPTTIDTVATAAMREALEPWLTEHRRRVETPLWTLWLR